MNNKIYIFDTTLRDGEQAPGASMTTREKLEIAYSLQRLGVDIMEVGFPVVSKGDFDSVYTIAKEITESTVCGLARSIKKDIDVAIEATKPAKSPRIHIFLATSKIHLDYKFKKSQEEILQMAVDAVKYARNKVDNIEFSPEDATRSDKDFLYKILEAVINAGATTVNIPDTVGYAVVEEYGELIKGIIENVSNINKAIVSTHCHDDLGLAVANSVSGIINGARQVECTVNGVGERAGNASMEEIVMGIKTREDFYKLTTSINTKEFCRISHLVSKYTGFSVPPNKAIVGGNAFRHESGIHQDGVLKEKRTYEIMSAEDVGFNREALVLGKHSGRHAFRNRLKQLGIDITQEQLDIAFERFKTLADKKKQVFDEDLLAIIEDELEAYKPIWTLENISVKTGTKMDPEVEIVLSKMGKEYTEIATGDGPVNACYKSIDMITKVKAELVDYSLQSVTEGKDALGEVTVKVRVEGKSVIAHGTSTDIVEASAKAYVNVINKFLLRNDNE